MDFKIWGYIFPIAFLLAQGLYISRYLTSTPQADQLRAAEPIDSTVNPDVQHPSARSEDDHKQP